MSVKNDNRFIYAAKFIACLLVITIHAPLPGIAGELLRVVSRVAVPFFFAVSGRFLLTSADTTITEIPEVRKRVGARLKKLLVTTGIVYLVYLVFSLFFHLVLTKAPLSEWVTSKYNLHELRIFILFNSGRFIYDGSYTFDHMWFLFALIYVYGLIWVFAPVLRKWYKGLIGILLFFLYFGEALQTFYPIRPFDISITTWFIMRNWLFVGMPFVLIGVLFADHISGLKAALGEKNYREKAESFRMPSLVMMAAGLAVSVLERYLIGEKEVYLGSLIAVVSILFLSEAIPDKGSLLSKLGKIGASNIYYYHVIVIAILDQLAVRGFIPYYDMLVKAILVIAICVLIFAALPIVFRRSRGRALGEE
jgi:hypothetical protein